MNLRLQRAQLGLRHQTPRFQVAILLQLFADHGRGPVQSLQVFTQIPAATAPPASVARSTPAPAGAPPRPTLAPTHAANGLTPTPVPRAATEGPARTGPSAGDGRYASSNSMSVAGSPCGYDNPTLNRWRVILRSRG